MARFASFPSDRCYFCGTTENVHYCSLCKKSFCDVCQNRYAKRIFAMITETVRRLLAAEE